MNVVSEKRVLREKFIELRKRLEPEERKTFSFEIVQKLKALLEVQSAGNMLSFKCIGSEVDLTNFNSEMHQNGKKLSFPDNIGEKIEVVIVPGLAFDLEGYRLGRGGGFYDKFLPLLNCLKIGVAFDFQVVEKLPREDHDAKLDFLVTEKHSIRFG